MFVFVFMLMSCVCVCVLCLVFVAASELSDTEGLVAEISVKRECCLCLFLLLNPVPVDWTKSGNLELIS